MEADRFEFGENWRRFLALLDDPRIKEAESSLKSMLDVSTLEGKRFLDVGSGSGLFSLAARRLGAHVHSFDYDLQSVACTRTLRDKFFPDDEHWTVEQGSALDKDYLGTLGVSDVVYSWGVLHHTGDMKSALENMLPLVREQGKLFIAIYNDQGWISRYWLGVKCFYNWNALGRWSCILFHAPYLIGVRCIVRVLKGKLKLERGMSLWYDMLDWLGGYPFEVATPPEVIQFYEERGFQLERVITVGSRMGCNEFVFKCMNR